MNRQSLQRSRALAAAFVIFCMGLGAQVPAQGDGAKPDARPELIPQAGHVNAINALAFSPDGKFLASAGKDRAVKLWNGQIGILLRTLTGMQAPVRAVCFAAASHTLFTAAEDGSVQWWDADTGTRLGDLNDILAPVTAIAVQPVGPAGDSLWIASAGADNKVLLWRLKSLNGNRELIGTLTGHTKPVRALAFSSDGKMLATGSDDGTVKTWSTEDGLLQYSWQSHSMPIRSLAFSADNTTVVDGSDDGISYQWNVRTGKRIGDRLQMNRPGDGITTVAYSPKGGMAATGGYGTIASRTEYVLLWNAAVEKAIKTLIGHTGVVGAVAFSPDGKRLASGGKDHTVRLWNTETGKEIGTGGSSDAVAAVAFSPTDPVLASASRDSAIRLWSTRTGELLHLLRGHAGSVQTIAYSPNGKRLASGGADQSVRLWDAVTGKLLQTWPGKQGEVSALAFSPDGAEIACGTTNTAGRGLIQVRNSSTGVIIKTLDAQGPGAIRSLAFASDGETLVSGTGGYREGTVSIWNVRTGELISEEVQASSTAVHTVAFSPNGKLLASGSQRVHLGNDNGRQEFGEIKVWNGRTHTLQRTRTLDTADGWMTALVFAGDNQTIYTGTQEGIVTAWNVQTGEPIRVLEQGHRGAVQSLALSPDGKLLAGAGADNTIRVWNAETGKLILSYLPLATDTDASRPAPLSTEWLAVTPEGYYDGSAAAARAIQWRVGPDLFAVESYEKAFHRPDRIAQALAGQTLPDAPETKPFVSSATVPPQITFFVPRDGEQVSGDKLAIDGYVTDVAHVARIELRMNGRLVDSKPIQLESIGKPIQLDSKGKPIQLDSKGKPIQLDSKGKPIQLDSKGKAKPIQLESNAKPIQLESDGKPIQLESKGKPIPVQHRFYQQFHGEIPVPPGATNITLSASAYSDNQLQAREEIHLTRPGATVKGTLYVLAVGVSKYHNSKYDLNFARQDAEAFADLWKRRAGSLYDAVNTNVLTDDQATTTNLRAALFKLQETATDNDTVTIFLSGHGVQDDDKYYFATHEIDAANGMTVAGTALPWTAFQTVLAAVRARRICLFLDACHSGNALGNQQASNERMAELLVKRSGVMVFAGSRGSELSYELDSAKHGAFTAALIEGLDEGKANLEVEGKRGDTITAEDLLAYLRRRVPQMTENQQMPSCPLLRDFGDSFPLVQAK